MHNINDEIFAQNLLLTQAYCETQLANADKSPAEIFRSFNPEYDGKPLYTFVKGQYSAPVYQSAQSAVYPFDHDKESFYTDLFELQLLNKRIMVTTLDVTSNYSGRILIADIDQSIPDGASEAESFGFIDEYDCPPVDTWFYIVQLEFTRRLYAWIPERFVELVNEGIDVNMLNIFNWQDNPRHIDCSKEPGVKNIHREYQYQPHEKYMPDRRYIFPIVCAVLLLIILLCWVEFHNYEG